MKNKGRLIVVSGPSGAGKTTLLKMLLNKHKDRITFSVSATSRSPRNNEVNAIDYLFVSKDQFEKGIREDKFIEYATVHGNYYGTSRDQVQKVLDSGRDCLLDVDVQGGLALMDKKVEAIYIFIAPPSIETLRERLHKRATDSEEVINRRVKTAENELLKKHKYDYIVVNDELNKAFKDLESIIY